MTSFVQVQAPQQHPGVERALAVATELRAARGRLDGIRGVSAAVLAGVIAAALVALDNMVMGLETAEMVVAWVALSVLIFAVIALGTNVAAKLGDRVATAWKPIAERRAQKRADAQYMAYAEYDPRVMHELQVAISRQEQTEVPAAPAQAAAAEQRDVFEALSLYESTRRARMVRYY
ncbi:hypothetical protein QTH91_19555 [Variovorax dokdonensis]|uniref:Phage holin family protein n=1 Tax=Variovorax dokdonensis TaxID=344883 RepID=A0ABT7NFH1_9BURK|nr:hypothetical protein [Variovorax dokdonensis]MDM0046696.1 hypothetical protein [Variovorax dokdonensis]